MMDLCPKVPKQDNSSDCGVYLLQYVESFFKVCDNINKFCDHNCYHTSRGYWTKKQKIVMNIPSRKSKTKQNKTEQKQSRIINRTKGD